MLVIGKIKRLLLILFVEIKMVLIKWVNNSKFCVKSKEIASLLLYLQNFFLQRSFLNESKDERYHTEKDKHIFYDIQKN